jgi:hypothetical protein
MQSMNQFVVPPILLREHCRYCLGKTEKAGRATIFFCVGIIRFDLAMHMMFSFHISFVFNKKKKNIGENLQDIFFGISDIACIFS